MESGGQRVFRPAQGGQGNLFQHTKHPVYSQCFGQLLEFLSMYKVLTLQTCLPWTSVYSSDTAKAAMSWHCDLHARGLPRQPQPETAILSVYCPCWSRKRNIIIMFITLQRAAQHWPRRIDALISSTHEELIPPPRGTLSGDPGITTLCPVFLYEFGLF